MCKMHKAFVRNGKTDFGKKQPSKAQVSFCGGQLFSVDGTFATFKARICPKKTAKYILKRETPYSMMGSIVKRHPFCKYSKFWRNET